LDENNIKQILCFEDSVDKKVVLADIMQIDLIEFKIMLALHS